MLDGIITLTTDFGEDSPYVAALKGVILGINSSARLLDLSHQIPPQDLRYAAFFLRTAIPYFPPEALHVVVVDPGVGTERALLYVEVNGHRLLVPDNGCWTLLARSTVPRVVRLTDQRYWRPNVSATFHGRDILAPAAGYLSRGLDPSLLGPRLTDWKEIDLPEPVREENGLRGEILFVDHFGNLITNIPGEALTAKVQPVGVKVNDFEVSRWVRSYAEAEAGAVIALVSSAGLLEIALSQGNAARKLGVDVGTAVHVLFPPAQE
jgi:S-adenosyl-L-methionine hydrolase (adenosine-forming)